MAQWDDKEVDNEVVEDIETDELNIDNQQEESTNDENV